jgi:RHS repeat-associated protein
MFKSALRLTPVFVFLAAIFPGVRPAAAQTPNTDFATDAGVKPFETYDGARENINLGTGNVNIALPLVNLPGRNGHDFKPSLSFNSQHWVPVGTALPWGNTTVYDLAWQYQGAGGLSFQIPYLYATGQTCGTANIPGVFPTQTTPLYCFSNFILVMEDGSKYSFPEVKTDSQFYMNTQTYVGYQGLPIADVPVGVDSTCAPGLLNNCTPRTITLSKGMVLDTIKGVVTFKDGSQLWFSGINNAFWGYAAPQSGLMVAEASQFVDANGNVISYSSGGGNSVIVTDTLGRTMTCTPCSSGGTQTFQYTNSNGALQTITLNESQGTTTNTVMPYFSAPAPTAYNSVFVPGPLNGGSSLTLPNGLTYTIQYNEYGEPTKITYPSGGYTRYDYQAFQVTYPWDNNNPNYVTTADYREVVAKHVCRAVVTPVGATSPGVVAGPASNTCSVPEDTTTYQPSISTWGVNSTNTVTDPLGNVTIYQFSGSMYSGPYEMSRAIYQGSSTLLKTINTTYGPVPGLGVASKTTILANGLQSKIEWDNDPSYHEYIYCAPETRPWQTVQSNSPCGTGAQVDTLIYPYNITEQREYGWGQGAPGSLMRKTDYTWLQTNPVNGADYDAPQLHILDRKTGETVYDGSGNQVAKTTYEYDNSSIALSYATQHLPAYNGVAYTTRGNVTAVSRWRNTDGAMLTTRNSYLDDAGNVLTLQDPLGHITQYSYADSWGNTTCVPSSGSAAAYVTRITNPLTQFTSATYNSCSGTMASTTDLNSQITNFAYDGMDRRIQATHPADGAQTCLQYSDAPNSLCPSYSGSALPINIVSTQKITSSLSKVTTTTLDGLSREVRKALSDQGVQDIVDTTYDGLGNVASVSNPYRAGDPVYTTQYRYDGLNRVTKVIPTDGTETTNNVTTSYDSNNTTVTDQAGKQRRSVSDALGRMIEVDEPGGGNGTPASGPPVTMAGNERTTVPPGTQATGSIAFTGINNSSQTVTVGTFTAYLSIPYNQGTNLLAQVTASALNGSGLVTANYSGSTVYLTSIVRGTAGNYSISVSGASANIQGMSGGMNGTTTYDTGNVSLTVNGYTRSVSYQQGSTQQSIATALAGAFGANNSNPASPVDAAVNGAAITLTAKIPGSASNFSLSTTCATTYTTYFSGCSFSITLPNPPALSGGTDYPTQPSLSTPAITLYVYDALDNLDCVVQKGMDYSAFNPLPGTSTPCGSTPPPASWRPRSFVYNSLSQLTSATNPESGAISYTYDNGGNLIKKVDARGVITCYGTLNGTTCDGSTGYDALHRPLKKTYSDSTPAATFTYDSTSVDGLSVTYPVGRLVKAATSNTRTVNSYDTMGRIRDQWQCTPANCGSAWFTAHYERDLTGDVTSQSNPFGFTLAQVWNTAGVMTGISSSLSDAQHPATLYTLNSYTAALLPTQVTLGNGLIEASAYNGRLQQTQLRVNNPYTGTDLLNMGYGFNYGTANNGNVASWSASGVQTFNRSYTYDAVNRLWLMSSPGESCTGLMWTYDFWANRSDQTGTGGNCYATSHHAVNAQNRIADTGYNYDTAGNMTADPATSAAYQYDAENRLISSASALGTGTYVYDANGKRVRRTANGTVTDYFYDAAGNVAAERVGSTWTKGYVYAGSLLAQYDNTLNPPTTFFVHKDHLGSTRLLTRVDRSLQSNLDYLPFGELLGGDSTTTHKFTGKERDLESGLDNFGARYDSSSLGRFMTPDPSPMGVAVGDPQSWNLYSYVRNRPLGSVDPNGYWATHVHAEIVTFAMQGYLSAGELKELVGRQYVMDADQSDQNKHAMINEGQSAPEALNSMWTFVASKMTIASQNVSSTGTLNKVGLDALGDAMHTVQDFTSPMHTDSNFVPMVWNGGYWPPSKWKPGAAHVLGEDVPSADWSRIGYAIRLTMAAYLQVGAACGPKKRCLTEANFESEVRNNIEDYVQYFYNVLVPPSAERGEQGESGAQEQDAARQCALGNPAACHN